MNKRFPRLASRLSIAIIVLLFSLSLWQLATAAWIQGKAVIAQQLLNHSWRQTVKASENANHQNNQAINQNHIITNHQSKFNKSGTHKPWPWADTWPVAKMMVPQHNIEQIVLAGDSGSSLAFGPGYSFASATPNSTGLTMISAHRDSHFSFLKDLKKNDTILLQTADKTIRYKVYDFQIVDSSKFALPSSSEEQTLVLVTCYPFDAVSAGGSLRYLVFANKQSY